VSQVACVGCGGALPHTAALCPRCTAPTFGTGRDDPWGAAPGGGIHPSYIHQLVLPERRPSVSAVTADLTSIAMILALVVMALTIVSVFVTFATVDGVPITLAQDRSAALALLASSVVAVAAILVARGPSGFGIGLLAGAAMNVFLLFQRLAAGTLADGSTIVEWELGFTLLAFAALGGLMTFLIALTGLRAGQRVTQLPSLVAVPVLAVIIAAIVFERESLLSVAYGLDVPARALTALALFLEGMLWVSAVATRSRLGAGMLLGSSVANLVVALDGAQPARGLLATVGFHEAAAVGATAGLVVMAAGMMAVTAWPENHPVRRGLSHASDAARLS
jgi:hypothetical protein